MIKADENQMEGPHLMGEIQSNEKSDFIRPLYDLIRGNCRFKDNPLNLFFPDTLI
jgi:hypothetical protein